MLKPAKHTRKDTFRFTVSDRLLPITEERSTPSKARSIRSNYEMARVGRAPVKKAKVTDKTFNIDIVFEDLKFKEVKTSIPASRGGRDIWKVYAAIENKVLEIEEKMKETEMDVEMEEIELAERKTEAGSKLSGLAIKKG